MSGRAARSAAGVRSRRADAVAAEATPHELRAFLRVAEDLHFGHAATHLGIAQSSLSETIRRLEAVLAAVLFERTSRRVELTDAGRRLVPVARRVLDGLAAAHEVSVAAHGPVRPFRIGIEAQGFAELNGPILRAFRERRPELALSLVPMIADPQAFIDAGLDVALVRTPLPDERLEVHHVADEARGILLGAGHPAAGARDASIEDFLDEEFVAAGPAVASTRDYWLAIDRRGGEAPLLGGEAIVASDVAASVAHLGLISMGCPSVVRAYPLDGLAFSQTPDLEPCHLGVATRAGDTRPAVGEFVEGLRAVVVELDGLAPGITPAPARPSGVGGER